MTVLVDREFIKRLATNESGESFPVSGYIEHPAKTMRMMYSWRAAGVSEYEMQSPLALIVVEWHCAEVRASGCLRWLIAFYFKRAVKLTFD